MCGGCDLTTLSSAQMSLPYAVAAALVFGATGIEVYRAERRGDPRIAALLARISVDVDPALGDLDEPTVTMYRKGAAPVSRQVPIALGDPRNPLPDDALLGKYRTLATYVLDAAGVDALADACLSREGLPDVRALQALLAGDAEERGAVQ
ncbi:MmgE/PrpD family protein [Burkholderia cepacia]|uniref:MmgE/PrpD family protein n=1 Tax=Burkholderia cepacia TaxID=292 RepID=UPI001E628F18|nr:MmgE/PrpD family protein [Burkholderia cepacia]